jgi:hypothetical protein
VGAEEEERWKIGEATVSSGKKRLREGDAEDALTRKEVDGESSENEASQSDSASEASFENSDASDSGSDSALEFEIKDENYFVLPQEIDAFYQFRSPDTRSVVDSGSAADISRKRSDFMWVAGEPNIPIKGISGVSYASRGLFKKNDLRLSEGLYFPELKPERIISVPRLVDRGFDVHFGGPGDTHIVDKKTKAKTPIVDTDPLPCVFLGQFPNLKMV